MTRRQRPHRRHGCWNHLIVAPLWVRFEVNLGTLMRTCDAVGACIAVPDTAKYRRSMDVGDTLKRRPHIHWVRGSIPNWVRSQPGKGRQVVAIELADDATPLFLVNPASGPTVILLGNESEGVPDELLEVVDECIQIPMIGRGHSLNVAVAGSLALYKLAGLS